MIYRICTTCTHSDKAITQFPCYDCQTLQNGECSNWEAESVEKYEAFIEHEEKLRRNKDEH